MSETTHLRTVITGLIGFAATEEEMLAIAAVHVADQSGVTALNSPRLDGLGIPNH